MYEKKVKIKLKYIGENERKMKERISKRVGYIREKRQMKQPVNI